MNQMNRAVAFAALDDAWDRTSAKAGDTSANVPLFWQYALIGLRWKRLIIFTVIGFLLAGLVVTFLMTPKYTASTMIEISREGNRIAPVQGVEREASDADLEFYQTQYGLLRSQSLAERVATQLRLPDDPRFFATFGIRPAGVEGRLLEGQPLPAGTRDDRRRQAAAILLRHIDVAPIRLSRLVSLNFTAPDRDLAARVANAWANNFITSTLERRYDATSYARKFLENRLGQLRQRLEESERQLVGYASRERIINVPTGAASTTGPAGERSIVADNLATLNAALNEATADRVKAEARLKGSGGGAVPEALQNTAISGLRQRRAEAAADYQKLLVQFQPDYPAAKALKAQLDQLDRSIAREESRVSSSLRGQYEDSLRREQELGAKVNELQNALLNLRQRSVQYQILQREADTNRQLYDTLLQRYKEIGVASGVGVNNIAIVDAADVPVKPSSPKLLLNLLLAALAGVVASAVLIFVLEQSGDSFDDPAKVERELGVSLLGTVPEVSGRSPLEALRDRKSELVEAYLSVETSLRFTTEQGIPRTISVTSTRPAEGKSVTSLALALLLARAGRRTLLIDGDMRSPSVDALLELPNDRGLSNYLSGADDFASLVRRVDDLGFDAMPSGPLPPNAAELLTGDRLAQLLERLAESYDNVVIDSPPVMGLADAPLIGGRVEGVVFAIESHKIRASLVRRAFERLRSANVRLLGAVLTKFRSDRAHLGYGYEYGYGYGQDGTRKSEA